MNKGTSDFAAKIILNLCYSKKELDKTYKHIFDSLGLATGTPIVDSNDRSQLWSTAYKIVFDHPERYFPELNADSLPKSRNPWIKEVLAINEIKKDSVWMWNLSTCQTVIQNAKLEQVLLMEAHNIIEGKPLMRDMANPEAKRDRVEQLVADMVEEVRGKPVLMQQIEEKAAKNGISLEKQTLIDARWVVNRLIKKNYYSLEDPQ